MVTHCRLVMWSRAAHLSQLLTGFAMLARRGAIRLTQELQDIDYERPEAPSHLRHARREHLLVIVNHSLRVYFDTHDGNEIDPDAIRDCDMYFKRSFSPSAVPSQFRHKVAPLGLNYEVYGDHFDLHELRRMLAFPAYATPRGKEFAAYLMRIAGLHFGIGMQLPVSDMQAAPRLDARARVLFIAKAWDPAGVAGFSPRKAEERETMNEMRAECISAMRARLGDRFLGGFQHDEFAARRYPKQLLQDSALSRKRTYLRLVRDSAICVTTTGLHGSMGWKLAEYVAFSKAILSEQLLYKVTGDFGEWNNYLSFSSSGECAERAQQLLGDLSLRRRLMNNNWTYYNAYLRPDALVGRAVNAALERRAVTQDLANDSTENLILRPSLMASSTRRASKSSAKTAT
jgi:hypothetical protein